jgi:hypothetical protein
VESIQPYLGDITLPMDIYVLNKSISTEMDEETEEALGKVLHVSLLTVI